MPIPSLTVWLKMTFPSVLIVICFIAYLFFHLDKRISKYFEWQFSLANEKTKTNRSWCIWGFVRWIWWWTRTVYVNLWSTSKVWRFQNWSSVEKKSRKTFMERRMAQTSTCWIICTTRRGLEPHVQGTNWTKMLNLLSYVRWSPVPDMHSVKPFQSKNRD